MLYDSLVSMVHGANPIGVMNPLVVEALALRDRVDIARHRGISWVILEMDCQELVKLWDE